MDYKYFIECNITSHEKKLKKSFIKHMSSIKLPVSVISNGVKQKILNFLEVKSLNNLYNIPNGSDIIYQKIIILIFERL